MRQFATVNSNHEWAQHTLIAAKTSLGAKITRLVNGDEARALEFLEREPLKNVTLIGSIGAYGLESSEHRGVFYAYTVNGRITGIALIGHWVLPSCGDDARAVEAFAQVAREHHRSAVEIVLGEEFAVEMFDRLFTAAPCARTVRSTLSQCLFTLQEVGGDEEERAHEERLELRRAGTHEVEEVGRAHASACQEIHGFDKQTRDSEGFRERMLARLEMGRIWIVRDAQGVAFKCDVVIVTDAALYLEGVWTRPDLRRDGFSRRVMKALCRKLLQECPSICLFADANNERVTSFYRRVGFENVAAYHLTRYNPALDESS